MEDLLQRVEDVFKSRTLEEFVISRLRDHDDRNFLDRPRDETPPLVLSELLKMGDAFPRRAELLDVLQDRVMWFVSRYPRWGSLTQEEATEAYWLGGLIDLCRPSDSPSLVAACLMWGTAAEFSKNFGGYANEVERILAGAGAEAASVYDPAFPRRPSSKRPDGAKPKKSRSPEVLDYYSRAEFLVFGPKTPPGLRWIVMIDYATLPEQSPEDDEDSGEVDYVWLETDCDPAFNDGSSVQVVGTAHRNGLWYLGERDCSNQGEYALRDDGKTDLLCAAQALLNSVVASRARPASCEKPSFRV